MVLSRKANDQNRTILVIYSNHRPTSFGIITFYDMRWSLERSELEVLPQHLDVVAVVDLEHDTARGVADKLILDLDHGLTVEPRLNLVALDSEAERVPLALL